MIPTRPYSWDFDAPGRGVVPTSPRRARIGEFIIVRSFPLMFTLIIAAMSLHRPTVGEEAVLPGDLRGEALKEFLKPVPPKEPEEAIKSFECRPGFRMELVASEPIVNSPCAATIDENGRMYVAELIDYPYRPREGEKPKGRIRLLVDDNGDGKYDRSTVFADGLLWAAGIAPWKGGVFVTAPPDIWYMKDTDGDGIADEKTKAFTGFGVGGAQYILNNLVWGMDHWIYGAVAGNGGKASRADQSASEAISLRERDVRFDPAGRHVEAISGNEQFGNTFDDWGNRFICNQSQPVYHVILPLKYLARNPNLPVEEVTKDLVPGPEPIYRTSPLERWRQIRSSRRVTLGERNASSTGANQNVLDSVAGTTIYRGDAYPPEFYGNSFSGEALNNIVHRRRFTPDGVTFRSERTEEGTEFVRSSDNWFRPVNFVNAPDGTLYVLDMSREIIEAVHIPTDVAALIDLTHGRDRGRIYRIRPDGFKVPAPPRLGEAATAELVSQLASPNGWWRDTAHRLIFERQDHSAVPALRKLLKHSKMPQARVLALWSLDGLGALTDADVFAGLDDDSPRVREQALILAEPRLASSKRLTRKIMALAADKDARVRFQTAFTLGEARDPRVYRALATIARADAADLWTVTAILSSTSGLEGRLLDELTRDAKFVRAGEGEKLFETLAFLIGVRGKDAKVAEALRAMQRLEGSGTQRIIRETILLGLGDGLSRQGRDFEGLKREVSAEQARSIDHALADAEATLSAASSSPEDRQRAIRMLGYGGFNRARGPLSALLDAAPTPAERLAALRTLSRFDSPEVASIFLAHWRGATPRTRGELLNGLLERPDRIGPLLEAIEAGTISPSEVPRTGRLRLTSNEDPALRARAQKVLAGEALDSREAAIEKFRPALALNGDAARGKGYFSKTCASCHQIGDVGKAVGPNLALARSQGAEELLMNILDPNSDVDPAYIQYTATQKDGREVSGIITGESPGSITIRNQDGQETILREDLRELTSSRLSMMPEGLEQDISLQEMADLIIFLVSVHYDIGTPARSPVEQ